MMNTTGGTLLRTLASVISAFWLCASSVAVAATIDSFDESIAGRNLTFIVLDGELNLGDDRAFANYAVQNDSAVVVLNSPGGNLIAGIEIGKAIRLKGFPTLVPAGFRCVSACALAWLGGKQRFMGMGATVGFHAAYVGGSSSPDSVGNAFVGAYLSQLGLSLMAIEYITEAPPLDMQWLTFADAEKVGIDVEEFPSSDARAAPSGPATNQWASQGNWIQLLSRSSKAEAVALGGQYASRYDNAKVFQYDNGWFVVALGPYSPNIAPSERNRLKSAGGIPADSLVVTGLRFVEEVHASATIGEHSASDDSVETRALNAAIAIQTNWSLPNAQAIAYLDALYPQELTYFGQKVLKAEVIKEKIEFAARWPVRLYSIEPGTLTAICNDRQTCQVQGILDWFASSPERQATSRGTASFQLTLSMGLQVRVLSETSSVLTRQVTKGQ
jgi:hypothetical protein